MGTMLKVYGKKIDPRATSWRAPSRELARQVGAPTLDLARANFVPVSEAEKKHRRTEAANAVTPLSVVDLVLLLKIPRRRYYCARLACDIARTSAHSTRFVDFCARYVLTLRALFSLGTKI